MRVAQSSRRSTSHLFPARKAITQYCQTKAIRELTLDDIWVGNGVSELIVMAMQALLNDGDEVPIPSPDYPLWTAAVSLGGGTARHYRCAEDAGWLPDLDDIRAKVRPATRAIVLINPNNPTGALYPMDVLEQVLELARRHHLIVFADEIYDKVVYDGLRHTSVASLADDVLSVTFNGLSKNYRACGYRAGWVVSWDASPASWTGTAALTRRSSAPVSRLFPDMPTHVASSSLQSREWFCGRPCPAPLPPEHCRYIA